MNDDHGLDREPSQTIRQFCRSENISPSKFYDLEAKGLGPETVNIDGIRRIPPESRRAWRERMKELAATKDAALERERRRALAQQAGRVAAQSDQHVSRRPHGKARQRRRGRR